MGFISEISIGKIIKIQMMKVIMRVDHGKTLKDPRRYSYKCFLDKTNDEGKEWL